MPSTIFAIYCHMLVYSRSASALRIAEVDNYHSSVGCTNRKYNPGGGDKRAYICQHLCSSDFGTGTQDKTKTKLEDCVKLIGKGVMAVQVSTDGKQCTTYKQAPKGATCKKGDANAASFYALQGSIFGDPHVVNMAGEKFDILTSGTFSLVSLTRATEEDLAINGTVVRFGTKCGQSFIDDLELTGGWIREFYNTKTFKVRAIQDIPQTEALQVNFGQKWQPLADLQEMARVRKTADAIQLDLSKLTVEVGAGKHKHHGWNFLNLDVQGLATLGDNIRVGGLLGYDDHTQVLQADADCAMFASAAETDMQDQQACLSYLKAN